MERISQSMLYSNIIRSLNKSTTRLQELQEQASTQKKINRPSDNAVGYGRILNYRDSINAINKYEENVNSSKGWLGQSDDSMQQVQDVMFRIKELTVQAANDSNNEENRESIYQEVRQLFDQMLSLSNTKYQGKSIFAGHKVEEKAYEEGVAVYSNKRNYVENYQGDKDFSELEPFERDKISIDDVTPYVKDVEGTVKDPVSIRLSKGDSSTPDTATVGTDKINYQVYQGDVQKESGTLDSSNTSIDLGQVKVDLKEGYEVDVNSDDGSEQTELYLAPTAYYQGDTRNKPGVEIKDNNGINVETQEGSFDSDVRVEVTNEEDLGNGNPIEYRYSLDKGANWTETMQAENNSTTPTLDLPGGKVKLSNAGSNNLNGLKFDINGTRVVQQKQDVNMTTTDDFDNKVQVRVTNNPDISAGDTVDYEYRSYDDSTQSWSGWNSGSSSAPNQEELNADFDGDGNQETMTFSSQGDINTVDNDSEFMVNNSDNSVSRVPSVHSVAQGNFDRNVQVRIDSEVDLGSNDDIEYSYSLDGGETWETGNSSSQDGSSDYQDLVVPGGMLKLRSTQESSSNTLYAGDQFTIQPRNAEHGLEVSQGSEVDINNLGPEVFGGHYKNESGVEPAFEKDQHKNLFLGLGKLMTSLKHNDQENISKSIGYVDSAIQQVSERLSDVGARMNRSKAAENMLSELKTNQKERKSEIEDVDFAKLMSQLNKQNTVYQTVLKSSSMIMRQSLVDYV
ncbi:MAG: flagellar hook-associated protein FlgL [Thermodesulfobacteriota bacterium]